MPEGRCKKCGKKYYGWALKDPRHRVCECGGEIEITYLPQSLPQTKGAKPTRHDVEIGTWAERDRIGIWLTDKRTDKVIAEWWDEDAQEMFDQVFFKPGDIRHQTITGRAFEESVLDYAESVGIIAGGKLLPQTERRPGESAEDFLERSIFEKYEKKVAEKYGVKGICFWTAVNNDTGEIVESFTPYTSSGRALRGGKAYAARHWKGSTALVEVWKQPHRYSENLKIEPVVSETLTGLLPQTVSALERSYSLDEAKKLAREKGVSTSGTKRTIISRLAKIDGIKFAPQTSTYYTVSFQGDTTFKPGEIVSEQAFKEENERVAKLKLRPARGWITSKGELRTLRNGWGPVKELEDYES